MILGPLIILWEILSFDAAVEFANPTDIKIKFP